jgi:hypothetical protein
MPIVLTSGCNVFKIPNTPQTAIKCVRDFCFWTQILQTICARLLTALRPNASNWRGRGGCVGFFISSPPPSVADFYCQDSTSSNTMGKGVRDEVAYTDDIYILVYQDHSFGLFLIRLLKKQSFHYLCPCFQHLLVFMSGIVLYSNHRLCGN